MKVLIVGLGSIGLKHVSALRKIDAGTEIYALRSSRNDATEVEGVQNFFSINELPAKPDFIIISNPTNKHKDTIKQVVSIGSPLFIEKPVLSNLADGEELLQLLHEKNILTYVACNLRFHPTIKYLKKALAESGVTVLEASLYCGSYLPDWRKNKDYRTNYSAHADMGGGVHLDLIHEIDYCYWLFGKPQKVHATVRKVSSLEINSMDSAVYTLEYDGFTASVTLNYFRRDPKRTIELVTDKGTIHADIINASITGDVIGAVKHDGFMMEQTYVEQLNYFIGILNRQSEPMNDFKEALSVLKIATCYEA